MDEPLDIITYGKPYPDKSLVDAEGCGWHTNGKHHLILVCLRNITAKEITQFESTLSFALVPYGKLLILLMQPPGQRWAEMPWAHLRAHNPANQDTYEIPEPSPTPQHQMVKMVVVEQTTGIVVGLRAFTWSTRFTEKVVEELSARINTPPISGEEMGQLVNVFRSQFASPEDGLVLSVARCRSGE